MIPDLYSCDASGEALAVVDELWNLLQEERAKNAAPAASSSDEVTELKMQIRALEIQLASAITQEEALELQVSPDQQS